MAANPMVIATIRLELTIPRTPTIHDHSPYSKCCMVYKQCLSFELFDLPVANLGARQCSAEAIN